MADPLDCLIDSARKNLKAYLCKRTRKEQAEFIWRYWNEVDHKTGVFCRRQWFHMPPEPIPPKKDRVKITTPPQKWYPPLTDSDYDFYRDGTPADSDEGRARNKKNTKHLNKILREVVESREDRRPMQRFAWDWETASEPVPACGPDPDDVAALDQEIPF